MPNCGKNIVHLKTPGNSMHFFYDAAGRPSALVWTSGTTTTRYAYVLNLQGDIVAIRAPGTTAQPNGVDVVTYTYDAWGRLLDISGSMADTLGLLNPFRYRGYVYDDETGLYYLRSRYYSPEWNRFVNADDLMDSGTTLLNHNLFTYCVNCPIINADKSGKSMFCCCTIVEGGSASELFSSYAAPPDNGPYLKKNRKPKNDITQIELSYMLAALNEMIVSGDSKKTRWNYKKGSMSWRNIDCVGIVRIIVQQISQTLCLTLPTTVDGMRKLCGVENEHMQEIIEGTALKVGYAVFTYDPDHINSKKN